MSNRHTSESSQPAPESAQQLSDSSQPAPESAQKPRITQVSASRVLLLRRRKTCKTCGRVHGPPQENCSTQPSQSDDSTLPDDGHLPWIF